MKSSTPELDLIERRTIRTALHSMTYRMQIIGHAPSSLMFEVSLLGIPTSCFRVIDVDFFQLYIILTNVSAAFIYTMFFRDCLPELRNIQLFQLRLSTSKAEKSNTSTKSLLGVTIKNTQTQ